MNIYIVGLNENRFEDADYVEVVDEDSGEVINLSEKYVNFDVLDECKPLNLKTIQTESNIAGKVKSTSTTYMPSYGNYQRIDEAQSALAENQLAEKEALKVNYQKQADYLINEKYGSCIVQIFTIVDPASFPKTAEANVFVMAVNAHALSICNAIDANKPYEFDLSQFSCKVTAQEIQTEIQG